MPGFGKSGMPRMWSLRFMPDDPFPDAGLALGLGRNPAPRNFAPLSGCARCRLPGMLGREDEVEGTMSETELRNTHIDTALAEAKEAYVARNTKSLARFVEATAVMPGGNTRTVLH